MTLYPDGYETEMVSLATMRARHEPRMHPEFARRFFPYIEHKGGLFGVGNGWRSTQPVKPGAAPDGQSFHQTQRFASGIYGYAAIDLVTTDGPDANNVHDTITWAMTADAPSFGLHTFIKSPVNEPWHIQCIEMRGWQTWVNAGRPDPQYIQLPGETTEGEDDLAAYIAIPPPERTGGPWLFVSSSVRPATTFDIMDGIPQRNMATIPAQYRVEQYDFLRQAAGV